MLSTPAVALAVCLGLTELTASTFDRQTPRDPSKPLPLTTATVTGRVTTGDPAHAVPIRGARVILEAASNATGQLTDTDDTGAFAFRSVPAGAYRVRAERAGFVWIGAHGLFEKPPLFEVHAGAVVSSDISLAPGAALEGLVTNDRGAPAENFLVAAVRLTFGPYGRQPSVIREVHTDDLGRFRVHSLPPGDYLVQAGADPQGGLARTYYDGTARIQDAKVVTLQIGQEVANLEFTITRVTLATVAGRVVDAAGQEPGKFSVRLQRVGGPPEVFQSVIAPSNHGFQLTGVPPGQYWLTASASPTPGSPPEFAATRLDVAGQDVTDLTLTTARGAAVDGRVEVRGGGVPMPAALQIVAHETSFELPQTQPTGGAVSSTATVAGDGSFAFAGLFGPRTLRLTHLPDGWALESVWLDKEEITDAATDFRPTETTRHLRVVLAPRTARVSGLVTTPASQPAARARVVIFADDSARWGIRSRFIRTVEASAAGVFAIEGLLPGRYAIAAIPFLDDGGWEDPTVLNRLRDGSTVLLVTGTEHSTLALTSLDLRLVR